MGEISSQLLPPSSEQVVRYLCDFCVAHRVCDQGLAALSAALHFPTLNDTGSISLPRPHVPSIPNSKSSTNASSSAAFPVFSQGSILEEYRRLPYYMTLSSNPWGILALLSGSFFDPAIECNLVSPWLEPTFTVIDSIVEKGDYKTFVSAMAKRQPSLAPLWLGATIVGLHKRVIQMARFGTPPIELHAGAWTETVHSFIGALHVQPAPESEKIKRSDECRLLFLTGPKEYERVPICPWQPFGDTSLEDAEIQIRRHVMCRHTFKYAGWQWNLEDDISAIDEGYMAMKSVDCPVATRMVSPLASAPKMTLKSETASAVATRNIFSWLRPDGWPTAESKIHNHQWFDVGESDESSDEENITAGVRDEAFGRTKKWLQGLEHISPEKDA